jgi:hypothetical protein
MSRKVIVNRYECGITPEPFQVIETPRFSLENVNNNVDVIQQNPRERPESFRVPQRHPDPIGAVTDRIGNRFDLSLGISCANHEKIRGSAELAEVQQKDI